MVYRPEIDGLRAIAVIPVIFFHAGFGPFGGGYIGVDVFLVISGYLITSLILTEKTAGTFTLRNFYERRARRILPALYFMIVACIPFAWMWMFPQQLTAFADSVVAVSVFVSNFLFFKNTGYFTSIAEDAPLLHTWSLAIEEQFYVLFPVAILALWRFGTRCIASVLVGITLTSLAFVQFGGNLNVATPHLNPDIRWFSQPDWGAFLLPAGRVWELMLGALVAIYLFSNSQPRGKLNNWVAGGGFLLVLYGIFAFDATTPFPSVYTLVPTVGTALIILFATANTFVGRLLSLPMIVGIGLISYSAYLWHHPLFVFTRLRSLNEPSNWLYALLIIATFCLAYLSWRYIEMPYRNRHEMTRRQIVRRAVLASCALIMIGLVGHFGNGFEERVPDDAIEFLTYKQFSAPNLDDCNPAISHRRVPADQCTVGAEVAPSIALVGDSHALILAYKFGAALKTDGLGAEVFTHSGCPPVTGLFVVGSLIPDKCPRYNEEVHGYLADHDEIRTVVVFARWAMYLEKDDFNNGEGGVEGEIPLYMAPVADASWKESDDHRRDLVAARYTTGIHDLLTMGKSVIVVYSSPEVGWNVPEYLARASMYGVEIGGQLSTSYETFLRRNALAHEALDAVGDHPNLIRIRPSELFCNTLVTGRCLAQLGGVPLYFDDDHLSDLGATLLADRIAQVIDN